MSDSHYLPDEPERYFFDTRMKTTLCEVCGRVLTYIDLPDGRRIPLEKTDEWAIGFNHYIICPTLERLDHEREGTEKQRELRAERKTRGSH